MRNAGALRRLFRHVRIYRSDVSFVVINPVQLPPPVGRPRYRAIARDGRSTPCPSSAMSSGRLFLDRVARQQCPSPLHRQPQDNARPRGPKIFIIELRAFGSLAVSSHGSTPMVIIHMFSPFLFFDGSGRQLPFCCDLPQASRGKSVCEPPERLRVAAVCRR
jgi:hypothetical protein